MKKGGGDWCSIGRELSFCFVGVNKCKKLVLINRKTLQNTCEEKSKINFAGSVFWCATCFFCIMSAASSVSEELLYELDNARGVFVVVCEICAKLHCYQVL